MKCEKCGEWAYESLCMKCDPYPMPRFQIDLSKWPQVPITPEERRELEWVDLQRSAWRWRHGIWETRILLLGFKMEPDQWSDEIPQTSPEFNKKIKEAIEIMKKHLGELNG